MQVSKSYNFIFPKQNPLVVYANPAASALDVLSVFDESLDLPQDLLLYGTCSDMS